MEIKAKKQKQLKRHLKVRAKIRGSQERPRMSVFASNRHIIAQIINDSSKEVLIYASDFSPELKKEKGTKTEIAKKVGELIAQKAIKKNIKKIAFDRGGKLYHGHIKALAEGAREKGLEF